MPLYAYAFICLNMPIILFRFSVLSLRSALFSFPFVFVSQFLCLRLEDGLEIDSLSLFFSSILVNFSCLLLVNKSYLNEILAIKILANVYFSPLKRWRPYLHINDL